MWSGGGLGSPKNGPRERFGHVSLLRLFVQPAEHPKRYLTNDVFKSQGFRAAVEMNDFFQDPCSIKFGQKNHQSFFGQIFNCEYVADRGRTPKKSSTAARKASNSIFAKNKSKRIETRKASTGCTKRLKSDFPTRALSEPSSESRRAGRGPRRTQNGPRERFGHFSLLRFFVQPAEHPKRYLTNGVFQS